MHCKVEICGVNTAKLKVLSNAQTTELLQRFHNGSKTARNELITGNLRLVLSVVQKFSNRGENMDDLFQVGCLGLMKAIDRFDLTLQVQFSTYAVPMIIGEIRRYLRDNSSIRISRSLRDNAYKALAVKEKYLSENQREPSMDEIAKSIGLPREEVVFALDAISDPVSLYEPVFSDGNGEPLYVMDQVRDTKNTDESWLERLSINDAVKKLSPRDRKILSLRFYNGKTQMEVAREIGISQAQVSRLEKTALEKIKQEI